MKIVCMIPARAGSKGIINKNIADLGGKPLVEWSLELLEKVQSPCTKILMTDITETRDLASRYPSINFDISRPTHLSGDTASVIDLALYLLKYLKEKGEEIDAFGVIQPTSPFRKRQDIDSAIDYFTAHDLNSLVAVSPVWHHPSECVYRDSENISPVLDWSASEKEGRQRFRSVDFISGAFYLAKSDWLLRSKTFCNKSSIRYTMDFMSGIDIDEPDHLTIARAIAGYLRWEF